jgi:hypothetical protein
MGEACSTYGRQVVYTGFWWREVKARDNLQDLGMDGIITIKWTELILLGTRHVTSACESGNGHSGFLK